MSWILEFPCEWDHVSDYSVNAINYFYFQIQKVAPQEKRKKKKHTQNSFGGSLTA